MKKVENLKKLHNDLSTIQKRELKEQHLRNRFDSNFSISFPNVTLINVKDVSNYAKLSLNKMVYANFIRTLSFICKLKWLY